MTILITGAYGFIGSTLSQNLCDLGYEVRQAVRDKRIGVEQKKCQTVVCELTSSYDWSEALLKIDAVVHLAARVHRMKDRSSDPQSEYRITNTHATVNLARQAAAAGVPRFIFLSSIKVNGGSTEIGAPFTPDSPTILTADDQNIKVLGEQNDPYALSKLEAEIELKLISEKTGMEVVIIRPPLVYGPGVKGNFYNLMKFLDKRVPLPLGIITNKRSP